MLRFRRIFKWNKVKDKLYVTELTLKEFVITGSQLVRTSPLGSAGSLGESHVQTFTRRAIYSGRAVKELGLSDARRKIIVFIITFITSSQSLLLFITSK